MPRTVTRVPDRQPPPGRSATKLDQPADNAMAPLSKSPQAAPSSRRRITGVLVTFTWDRAGELFVLHDGRNVIGKGNVDSEGGRPCDVLLPGDDTMSSEHAVILCRDGRYQLYDRQSTNGTYADGQFVESNGVDLQDGARIKTGETVWLFRKIQSDSGGAPKAPEKARPSVPPESHVV